MFRSNVRSIVATFAKKNITEETQKAINAISNFLSMLANYYDKDSKNEIEW